MGSKTIRYPADLFINSCSNKMSRGTIIAQNNAIIQLGYKIERDSSTFCTFHVSKNTKLARICTTLLPEASPHLHIADKSRREQTLVNHQEESFTQSNNLPEEKFKNMHAG